MPALKIALARLEQLLLTACDALHGNKDASEDKKYILAILFLKRATDHDFLTSKVQVETKTSELQAT